MTNIPYVKWISDVFGYFKVLFTNSETDNIWRLSVCDDWVSYFMHIIQQVLHGILKTTLEEQEMLQMWETITTLIWEKEINVFSLTKFHQRQWQRLQLYVISTSQFSTT